MRGVRTTVAALVAVVALGALVPSARADDVRVYRTSSGDPSMDVRATCSGSTCSVVPVNTDAFYPRVWTEPLTVTNGLGRLVLPDTCGADDGHAEITLTVTLTATELVATRTEKGGVVRPRPNYTCTTKGFTLSERLTLVTPASATPSAPASVSAVAPPGPPSSTPGSAGPADGGAATADGPGGLTVSRLATGASDAPSVLSGLRTLDRVDPLGAAVAALVTVVLVLLLAFPTSLLNSAAETGTDRLSTWWRRRRGLTRAADEAGVPWWWAAAGVLAAGVVSSFVDPQFGLNPGSVRTVASVVVGVTVEVALGWAVVVLVVRRVVPGARPSFSFAPATLLLVAAAVLATRLTGFEPGIVFGLVAGVGFATLAGASDQARVVLVPLAVGAAVGLASWAAYHLVAGSTGTTAVFVTETLSAVTIAGLVALPLTLVPIPGLGGHVVYRWDRRVWGACYAFGLFAFFVVLMPTPYAWHEVSWGLRAWVLAYLAYVVLALAAWWLARRGLADEGEDEATAHDSSLADV